MDKDDLDRLQRLSEAATPAPWHVCVSDDHSCMSMVLLATTPDIDDHDPSGDFDKVIAATLVQSPPYAIAADQRWDENADLIAAMRNALPALLGLARRGLNAADQP